MGIPLASVTTATGRSLGVAQWGDLDGVPVLSLHGTPGSRLGRHPAEDAVAALGRYGTQDVLVPAAHLMDPPGQLRLLATLIHPARVTHAEAGRPD